MIGLRWPFASSRRHSMSVFLTKRSRKKPSQDERRSRASQGSGRSPLDAQGLGALKSSPVGRRGTPSRSTRESENVSDLSGGTSEVLTQGNQIEDLMGTGTYDRICRWSVGFAGSGSRALSRTVATPITSSAGVPGRSSGRHRRRHSSWRVRLPHQADVGPARWSRCRYSTRREQPDPRPPSAGSRADVAGVLTVRDAHERLPSRRAPAHAARANASRLAGLGLAVAVLLREARATLANPMHTSLQFVFAALHLLLDLLTERALRRRGRRAGGATGGEQCRQDGDADLALDARSHCGAQPTCHMALLLVKIKTGGETGTRRRSIAQPSTGYTPSRSCIGRLGGTALVPGMANA